MLLELRIHNFALRYIQTITLPHTPRRCKTKLQRDHNRNEKIYDLTCGLKERKIIFKKRKRRKEKKEKNGVKKVKKCRVDHPNSGQSRFLKRFSEDATRLHKYRIKTVRSFLFLVTAAL